MTKDRDNIKGSLILGTDKISQVPSIKNPTNRLLKADTHPDLSPIWALQQLLYYDCGFYSSFRIWDESQSSLELGAQWHQELCLYSVLGWISPGQWWRIERVVSRREDADISSSAPRSFSKSLLLSLPLAFTGGETFSLMTATEPE